MPKKDLYLAKPLLNAAGFLGHFPNGNNADAIARLGAWGGLGAFVTDPISYLPRPVIHDPALIETDSGTLLHNGLPSAGFWQHIKVAARKWDASPLPVIVHLLAEDVERTLKMVRALESMENVLAVEIGLPLYRPDQPAMWLDALPMLSVEMPIIANIPMPLVEQFGERFVRKGASAISMRPPRGRVQRSVDALPFAAEATEAPAPEWVSGRLFGSVVFAQAVEVIYRAGKAGLPLIASGGIDSPERIARAMAEGALAVQLDLPCWY